MNGAESVLKALEAAGVEVCFANPGTSEMHLVSAIDRSPAMRPVLALFEGVVSGAADGYARMSGKPAACLLHLGPGFANAMANIHNASRAGSPMINLVGDHATYHLQYDAPLNSDIEAIVSSVSDWTRRSKDAEGMVQDVADAIGAANSAPGKIASLIVPADLAWSKAPEPVAASAPAAFTAPDEQALESAFAALNSDEPCAIMLGGNAMVGEALETAGRIAAATGASLITDCFPARMQRGAGVVPVADFGRVMAIVQLSARSGMWLGAGPGRRRALGPSRAARRSIRRASSAPSSSRRSRRVWMARRSSTCGAARVMRSKPKPGSIRSSRPSKRRQR